MDSPTYDRFGLTANPFRDLASEGIDTVELFHVPLEVDRSLGSILDEALGKGNRAVAAVTGIHGSGKTERLRYAEARGRDRGAWVASVDFGPKSEPPLSALGRAVTAAARLGGFARVLARPPWFRELESLGPDRRKPVDPLRIGRALGAALDAHAPALLLLNDLHFVAGTPDADSFFRSLEALADSIRPGVLVLVSSLPSFLASLATSRPGLHSRFNRIAVLPPFRAPEAGLLLAKRMLPKRLVERLDPLFPFDAASVEELTIAAAGNPRRILEMADWALEHAATRRAYRIDTEALQAALAARPLVPAPTTPADPRSGAPALGRAPAPG